MQIIPPWPPPIHLRTILRNARRRYHRLTATGRPAIDDPTSAMMLFGAGELRALALSDCWPLTRRIRRWIIAPNCRQVPWRRIRAHMREIAIAVARMERGR